MTRCGLLSATTFVVLAIATTVPAAEPDAAALVRQVRERDAWIEHVDSLQIKAVQYWERTPKGLEHRRRMLEKDSPGGHWENHPDLRPRCKWTIEQAYDRTRLRLRVLDEGYSDDLRVWDGSRFFLQNRYGEWPGLKPDQDGTLIGKDPARWMYWLIWSNFASFRAGPHLFWWTGPKERADIVRLAAKPEDFAYEGRADFHGITCHVVSHWDSWTSLFIGVDDGRLHGIKSGALTTTKFHQSLITLLREAGRPIKDQQDLERQSVSITAEERDKMRRLGAVRLTQLIDPVFEYRLALNKEVAPGCRLPLTQSIRFFEVDDDGKAFESQSNELRIIEVKVNEPLPDSLFTVAFKEGERITDQTTDPPLSYRYKAKMTAEEWSKIREEATSKLKAQSTSRRIRKRALRSRRSGTRDHRSRGGRGTE